MRVLTLNSGSSSLKAAVYDLDHAGDDGVPPPAARWHAEVENAPDAIDQVLAELRDGDESRSENGGIDIIGHRVVHGGATLVQSTRVTPQVRAAIARVADYAPLHNAESLALVEAATRVFGKEIPQVAVFDTAFHSTLPPAEYTYAGPFAWLSQGIRRYGFHGLSHRYASHRMARLLVPSAPPLRVVSCHLGSGCSLAAVLDGRSVATTMGFTPLDGVPMATRSGALDPGILLHLMRRDTHTADSLDDLLNHDAGLAGLSGTSGDMRDVLTALDAGSARARLAFDVYVHHLRQSVAAMAASMNGLDALVFTGGVGQHAPRVRSAVCDGLAFLGVALDVEANASCATDAIVSSGESRVAVGVVRAEENWVIAQECVRVESSDVGATKRA